MIIGVLRPASDLLGCGNIVNWNLLEIAGTEQASDFLRILGIDI
jgi:hypothetical protein